MSGSLVRPIRGGLVSVLAAVLLLTPSSAGATTATLVKDIGPGPEGNLGEFSSADVAGRLYFGAADSTHGRELWESDGTAAGTRLVKDIYPGSRSSDPWSLAEVGGELLFSAHQRTQGSWLWKSDGTKAGTTLVRDVGCCLRIVDVAGTAFLEGYDRQHGFELWKSDGTPPARSSSRTSTQVARARTPLSSRELGDTLFFQANDGTHGEELWKSDGTAPRHEAGQGHQSRELLGDPFPLGTWRERSSFSAAARWWALEVRRDRSGNNAGQRRRGPEFAAVGRELFFEGFDSSHGVSSGSPTARRREQSSSRTSTLATGARFPCRSGTWPGTLFFEAYDPVHGRELWKSDGTRAGTTLVKDIIPGRAGGKPTIAHEVSGEALLQREVSRRRAGSSGSQTGRLPAPSSSRTSTGATRAHSPNRSLPIWRHALLLRQRRRTRARALEGRSR